MRRLMVIVLILALAMPVAIGAQAPDLTETYSDSLVTLHYPAGWTALRASTGAVRLSNRPEGVEDEDFGEPMPSDLVTISIPTTFRNNEHVLIAEDSPDYLVGYFVANLMVQNALGSLGRGTFSASELTPITVQGRPGVTGHLLIEDTDHQVEYLLVAVEGPMVILVIAPTGELDQWLDTVWAIAETLQIAGISEPAG